MVAFAVDGTQAAVAAGDVVWVDTSVEAPGCMATVVVLVLVGEPDIVHVAVAL